MLKYSIFVVDATPLHNRERVRIHFPQLGYWKIVTVDDFETKEELLHFSLVRMITYMIDTRKQVPVCRDAIEGLEGSTTISLGWLDELKIVISNGLVKCRYGCTLKELSKELEPVMGSLYFDDFLSRLLTVGGRPSLVDVGMLLEIADRLGLPIKIDDLKVSFV